MISFKPLCLRCSIPLVRKLIGRRHIQCCPKCLSYSTVITDLRDQLTSHEYEKVIYEAKQLKALSSRGCPFCRQQMKLAVRVAKKVDLDLCLKCQIVWYDTGESQQLSSDKDISQEEYTIRPPSSLPDEMLILDPNVQHMSLQLMNLQVSPAVCKDKENEVTDVPPYMTIAMCILIFIASAWSINYLRTPTQFSVCTTSDFA